MDSSNPSLQEAVAALAQGELAVLPTETVYGLAARIDREDSIRRIFEVKGRPLLDPLIVHILNRSWLDALTRCSVPQRRRVDRLAEAFWPGPLTILLPKSAAISPLITAGKQTVALRCPSHPIFREILRQLNVPLAAPSANPFGYVSPTKLEHVRRTLGKLVKYMVDGGDCRFGLESTILDLNAVTPRILRPGIIDQRSLEDVLGIPIAAHSSVGKNDAELDAPGMLKQHYSPHTPLFLFKDQPPEIAGQRRAVVYLQRQNSENNECIFAENCDQNIGSNTEEKLSTSVRNKDFIFWLSEDGNLLEIARNIFSMLQNLDRENYSQIYFQIPKKNGIGIAIVDRLERAAAKLNLKL